MGDELFRPTVTTPKGGSAPPPDGGATSADRPGVFRNRFGHWRAGWRFVLYLALVMLLGLASTLLRGVLPSPGGGSLPLASWWSAVRFGVQLAVLVVAAAIALRWIDQRPVTMLGLGFEPGWGRELAIGVGAGIGLVSAVAIVLVVTGRVTLVPASEPLESLAALPRFLLVFLLAGAAEEVLFRGYPMQVLAEGTRPWIAALVTSALFALVHLDNPDATTLGGLNILLIGILLAVGYFQTRRLWLPVGLHLAFNLAQSWLWGFDVSGYDVPGTLLEVRPAGPDLITGGGFGIEGSVVTTIIVTAVLGWAVVVRALRPEGAVADTWARYPRGCGLPPVDAGGTGPPEEHGDPGCDWA